MIVECKKCEALVDAMLLKDYSGYDNQEGPPYKYSFLKCPKCNSPFLVVQENYGGDYWDDPYRLYPTQDKINPFYPEPIKKHTQKLRPVSKQKLTRQRRLCVEKRSKVFA